MLIVVPALLSPDAARAFTTALVAAEWVDGRATSGPGAALAKRNRQLADDDTVATEAARQIRTALAANALFLSAALPAKITPPRFSRYGRGDAFGTHIDNAIHVDAVGTRVRTDLAATLFLAEPASYDGGALTIEGSFGTVEYKCAAGDLLLYPASSLHRVAPVTGGERVVSFFWIESLVRDAEAREMLFDLDQSVQALTIARGGDDREVLRLTRLYHNLMRRWSS